MPPRVFEWPEFKPDPHGHPTMPPLRTFRVKRMNIGSTVFYEEVVEGHRYYTDPSGSLCFEMLIYLIKDRTVTTQIPVSMAPGTWFDCRETTVFKGLKPAYSLQ